MAVFVYKLNMWVVLVTFVNHALCWRKDMSELFCDGRNYRGWGNILFIIKMCLDRYKVALGSSDLPQPSNLQLPVSESSDQ